MFNKDEDFNYYFSVVVRKNLHRLRLCHVCQSQPRGCPTICGHEVIQSILHKNIILKNYSEVPHQSLDYLQLKKGLDSSFRKQGPHKFLVFLDVGCKKQKKVLTQNKVKQQIIFQIDRRPIREVRHSHPGLPTSAARADAASGPDDRARHRPRSRQGEVDWTKAGRIGTCWGLF